MTKAIVVICTLCVLAMQLIAYGARAENMSTVEPAQISQMAMNLKANTPGGVAAKKKCCANCSGGSCNTCNSPSTNPITGKLYCPALQHKATCSKSGCKPGWMKRGLGFKAG